MIFELTNILVKKYTNDFGTFTIKENGIPTIIMRKEKKGIIKEIISSYELEQKCSIKDIINKCIEITKEFELL